MSDGQMQARILALKERAKGIDGYPEEAEDDLRDCISDYDQLCDELYAEVLRLRRLASKDKVPQ